MRHHLIPDEGIAQDRVPPPAALLRDLVNTLDHELGTDGHGILLCAAMASAGRGE